MEALLFPKLELPTVEVLGESKAYPINRIFCVGRNYAEHAKEMGVEVDREAPFYFLKSALSFVPSGGAIPYPPGTSDYHYEMELVMAIGAPVFKADKFAAAKAIYAYGAGLDMTRRDLQLHARGKGRPWDLGKDFEQSAILAPLTHANRFGAVGPQRIALWVGATVKQDAKLADLVWSPVELVSHLSHYYHLQPGDLIYTGTPAGVGPVNPGDKIRGAIDGLSEVTLTIGKPE